MEKNDSRTVKVLVNGSELSLNPFVTSFIEGTVLGMLSSLRGGGKPREVQIVISSRKREGKKSRR